MLRGDQVGGNGGRPGPGQRPVPAQFAVSERRDGNGTVVSVSGELDLLTAPTLGARLADIVRTGAGDLLVDLQSLDFMDSAGLHVLVDTQQQLAGQSRKLKVRCRPGSARRLIELAQLGATLGLGAG